MKFLFVLCALLLAGAVFASDAESQEDASTKKPGPVNRINNRLVAILNEAIKLVGEKVIEIQGPLNDYLDKLKEEAARVGNAAYENILDARQAVTSEIDRAIRESAFLNLTECAEMAEAFDQTGFDALVEVSRCTYGVREVADGYMENIRYSTDIVLKNLTNIIEEGDKCVENTKDWSTAAKDLLCINVAAAKGTWAATKNVPAVIVELGKLALRITSLLPEMTICSTINSVKKVNQNSGEVVEKVKECIRAHQELADSKKSE